MDESTFHGASNNGSRLNRMMSVKLNTFPRFFTFFNENLFSLLTKIFYWFFLSAGFGRFSVGIVDLFVLRGILTCMRRYLMFLMVKLVWSWVVSQIKGKSSTKLWYYWYFSHKTKLFVGHMIFVIVSISFTIFNTHAHTFKRFRHFLMLQWKRIAWLLELERQNYYWEGKKFIKGKVEEILCRAFHCSELSRSRRVDRKIHCVDFWLALWKLSKDERSWNVKSRVMGKPNIVILLSSPFLRSHSFYFSCDSILFFDFPLFK